MITWQTHRQGKITCETKAGQTFVRTNNEIICENFKYEKHKYSRVNYAIDVMSLKSL